MNTKILVCCHKKDVMATQEPFFPIHVGKALHADVELGIQTDSTGGNISEKNSSYCELTGMYWAWKNLKNTDIIGLNHYRRYFDFHNQAKEYYNIESFPSSKFNSLDLSIPDTVIERIKTGIIVTAKPIHFDASLAYNYCYHHNSSDFRALQHVIATSQPDHIKQAFWEVMYQNYKLMPYNMFLMRWQDFDKYCTWLFDILKRVEDITDISDYGPIQKRIYGYMGERLFNVWLKAENKSLLQRPVIWINEEPTYHLSKTRQFLANVKLEISHRLLKAHYTGLSDSWRGTTKD